MQTTIQPIDKSAAAAAFAACAGLDPLGLETPHSAAMAGDCFAVSGAAGAVAFSVDFREGGAWIVAAAGGGVSPMAGTALRSMEAFAKARGCAWIGFQTLRKGLHRIAQRRGYSAKPAGLGFILEKTL